MRLYFIRHGQSENNALYARTSSDYQRVDDPKLTEIGRFQAETTAEYLAKSSDPVDISNNDGGFELTRIYTSMMHRSITTGTIIANRLNIPLNGWGDWHENGGIYFFNPETGEPTIRPGLTRSEATREFPRLLLEPSVGESGWWNRPWETEDIRPIRARRVLRELLARHGDSEDRVAVISHGGFFMTFLAAMLGYEKIQPVWFRLYNCAITRFDFYKDEQVLVYHNHATHLGRELIT